MLGEVTVQSDQLSIERTTDRYTISNVYTSPLAARHTISDVLRFTPLVNVDNDGELSILNKGQATIYINGRKSSLDPKNIPAESIEKIEVITSPGSEFPSDLCVGVWLASSFGRLELIRWCLWTSSQEKRAGGARSPLPSLPDLSFGWICWCPVPDLCGSRWKTSTTQWEGLFLLRHSGTLISER